MGRRGFMELTGAAGIAALSSSGIQPQIDTDTAERHGVLVGQRSARPALADLRNEWDTFQFVYLATDGGVYHATERDGDWRGPVSPRTNIRLVYDESDLPPAENGTHTLQDGVGYVPMGFVLHEYPLELNGTNPLLGMHGGLDGFVYSGAGSGRGAAVQGTDANFFMRDLYLHAPGATLLDLTATTSEEMLVESYSTNDAAGLGNAGSLGTIEGYKVPTFKGCNFGDFDAGLTFDGTSNKIAFFQCPIRSVSASNVDALTLAGSATTEFIDMASCYFKDVQSDTVLWRLDSRPTEALQLRGTLIDPAATFANVIVDSGGTDLRDEPGIKIATSFPLADSNIGGEIDLDSAGTVTGSATGTTITNATTAAALERMSSPSDGVLEYNAEYDSDVVAHISGAVSGSTTTFIVELQLNGSRVTRSRIPRETKGGGSPVGFAGTTRLNGLTSGDQLSAYLEDTGGSSDLTLEAFQITV